MLILIITENGNNRRLRFFDTTLVIYLFPFGLFIKMLSKNMQGKTKQPLKPDAAAT